ncbi:MAG TPA: thioredoxin family protein [Thermoanaerobaculia bacterium]|jgi:thiol-disulfide isomerase/thioredoxin|nr:thioredoxin family protein [Thermoanaerobaculia bacterium]
MSPRSYRQPVLILLAAALLAPLGAHCVQAQMIPADAVLRDFEPLGDYYLEVGGARIPEVELFRSEKAGSAVLVFGPGLRGVTLLQPRAHAVQTLSMTKVAKRADGRVDVLADAVLTPAGDFTIDGREISFTIEGKAARLREKPYLLGLHPGRDLLLHDATYSFRAKLYQPSPALVNALRQATKPVRIRVFFGSWCPHCQQMVPRILRLEDALAGSTIHFEFYGLPTLYGEEPEAKRMGIDGVPTGVVYRGNREVGRIAGEEWSIPELAIKKILENTPKSSR